MWNLPTGEEGIGTVHVWFEMDLLHYEIKSNLVNSDPIFQKDYSLKSEFNFF
jgi:hypothetical protein